GDWRPLHLIADFPGPEPVLHHLRGAGLRAMDAAHPGTSGRRQMISRALHLRRRIANSVFIVLSIAAALCGLVWLAFILSSLLSEGVAALSPILFTQSTPPPGQPGGLLNDITGSVIMSVAAVILGTPIGLFAG